MNSICSPIHRAGRRCLNCYRSGGRPGISARAAVVSLVAGCFALSVEGETVRGRVGDTANDFYLQGAEVRVVKTGRSTFTQRGGSFRISGLDAGRYVLEVSAVGLEPVRKAVVIADGIDEMYVLIKLKGGRSPHLGLPCFSELRVE